MLRRETRRASIVTCSDQNRRYRLQQHQIEPCNCLVQVVEPGTLRRFAQSWLASFCQPSGRRKQIDWKREILLPRIRDNLYPAISGRFRLNGNENSSQLIAGHLLSNVSVRETHSGRLCPDSFVAQVHWLTNISQLIVGCRKILRVLVFRVVKIQLDIFEQALKLIGIR